MGEGEKGRDCVQFVRSKFLVFKAAGRICRSDVEKGRIQRCRSIRCPSKGKIMERSYLWCLRLDFPGTSQTSVPIEIISIRIIPHLFRFPICANAPRMDMLVVRIGLRAQQLRSV